MRCIRGTKNKTGRTVGNRLQTIPGGHPKGVDVMRNILTKYTTRAGLYAMALVLAAALVLAGCKQEAEPSRQETQLEKDIKALAGKGAGSWSITATGTVSYDDIPYVRDALNSLPNGVMVELDLSNVTGLTKLDGGSIWHVQYDTTTYFSFYKCTTLKKIILPNTITGYLGGFTGCTNLESITIKEGVSSIGGFIGCTALKEVTIPESVTSIEQGAFSTCTSLAEVTIPKSVNSIGREAFYNCTDLTSVTFTDNTSTWTVNGEDVQVNEASTNATNLTNQYAIYQWSKKKN